MSQLLEHILNGDYVSANDLFEERMVELQEKKLYESKRMIQAEAVGGLTKADIEARRKAGYRKASDVLDDPRDRPLPLVGSKRKSPVKRKKVNEMVDVQPDPEGRIRGGNSRPVKGTFKRKVAAGVLKTARKMGNIAADTANKVSRAKEVWGEYQKQKAQQSASPFPTDMHQTQQAAEPTRTQKAAKDAGKWALGKYGAMAKTFFEDSEN